MKTISITTPGRMGRGAGFTLVEVMIVVVIIGILSAIAYPSYLDSVRKARRADAKTTLHTIVQALERYRIRNNGSYANATLAILNGGSSSTEGHYTLAFGDTDNDNSTADEPTTNEFLLIATATGTQSDDNDCASFTIDQAANQNAFDGDGNPATVDCWQ